MLERIEAMASRVIEGWSARLFRARLQPVQIGKRVIRAMEGHQTISLAKTFVPNSYLVSLSPSDYAQFEQYKRSLERDLAEAVLGAARDRAQRHPLTDPRAAAVAPGDHQRGDPELPRRNGRALVGEGALQGVERTDQEQVQEDEKCNPDGPQDDRERDLHQPSRRTTSSAPPMVMRSSSESTISAMRRPFTKVPFVLCRS